ncbi:hypothetical protein GCM10009696_24710 [Kocuria himachalensis]
MWRVSGGQRRGQVRGDLGEASEVAVGFQLLRGGRGGRDAGPGSAPPGGENCYGQRALLSLLAGSTDTIHAERSGPPTVHPACYADPVTR